MPKDRIITMEDFERREVGYGVYYMSLRIGKYEITVEPHISCGYTVGIYDTSNPFIAISKRAVWKKNHPTSVAPHMINTALISTAMGFAQDFHDQYITRTKPIPRSFKEHVSI